MGVIKFAAAAKATIKTKGFGGRPILTAAVTEIGKIIAAAALLVIYDANRVVINKIPNKSPKEPNG